MCSGIHFLDFFCKTVDLSSYFRSLIRTQQDQLWSTVEIRSRSRPCPEPLLAQESGQRCFGSVLWTDVHVLFSIATSPAWNRYRHDTSVHHACFASTLNMKICKAISLMISERSHTLLQNYMEHGSPNWVVPSRAMSQSFASLGWTFRSLHTNSLTLAKVRGLFLSLVLENRMHV